MRSRRTELVRPDEVTLTDCDREAIHLPASIQDRGHLLVVDPASERVVGASRDAGNLLAPSVRGEDLIGRPVGALTDPALASRLTTACRVADARPSLLRGRTAAGDDGAWLVHRSGQLVVVEQEDVDTDARALDELIAQVTATVAGLALAPDLERARELAANAVRDVLGVDRAMIYLFHPDGHGEVVAEAAAAGLDPFLGLHYPATDIPRQARALYVRNWVRVISDVDGAQVPVVDEGGPMTTLDLSASHLRSVSPIHLQYLRNMGVRASMSLSLVEGEQLVGLIACHHGQPLRVGAATRAAVELLARQLSELLARSAAAARDRRRTRQRDAELAVLGAVAETTGTRALPSRVAAELRHLVTCDAALVTVDHTTAVVGDAAPEPEALAATARALLADRNVAATTDARDVGPGVSGGLLAARNADGTLLAWWRLPVVATTRWAGRPDHHETTVDPLQPRASFDAFLETVDEESPPWAHEDHEVATRLVGAFLTSDVTDDRSNFERVVAALTDQNQHLVLANRRQRTAADDLEAVLALAAHDLRGLLAVIGGNAGVLPMVLASPEPSTEHLATVTAAIQRGVRGMDGLLDDLQRWARTGTGFSLGPVDLDQAVGTALLALSATIDAAGAHVRVGALPTVPGDAALLREALQNLVENAVKYRAPDRPCEVTVEELLPRGVDEVVVEVRDNGIGIAPPDHQTVLRAFHQLDRRSTGSGLGLALVSRIVQRHGGQVTLDSAIGEGTTFRLHLPTHRMVHE